MKNRIEETKLYERIRAENTDKGSYILVNNHIPVLHHTRDEMYDFLSENRKSDESHLEVFNLITATSTTVEEFLKKTKDYKYVSHPEGWVTNLCPIKKMNGRQVCKLGFLRRTEFMTEWQDGLTVYMTNIYTIRGTTHWPSIPQKHYDDIDTMLADGWEVD